MTERSANVFYREDILNCSFLFKGNSMFNVNVYIYIHVIQAKLCILSVMNLVFSSFFFPLSLAGSTIDFNIKKQMHW